VAFGNAQNPDGSFDPTAGGFALADDAINGWFNVQAVKAAGNGFAKAPSSSLFIIVGGLVLLVFLLKR